MERQDRGKMVTAVVLIAIGLLILVGQLVRAEWVGMLVLPTLGLIFLVWGLLVRSVGLLVPGGVLSGIGVGALLIEMLPDLSSEQEGGVFMLSFAGGWVLITVFSRVVEGRAHLWPLIPGGIMAVIGGGLLIGGAMLRFLEWLGTYWPVVLVLIGLWMLVSELGRKPVDVAGEGEE